MPIINNGVGIETVKLKDGTELDSVCLADGTEVFSATPAPFTLSVPWNQTGANSSSVIIRKSGSYAISGYMSWDHAAFHGDVYLYLYVNGVNCGALSSARPDNNDAGSKNFNTSRGFNKGDSVFLHLATNTSVCYGGHGGAATFTFTG